MKNWIRTILSNRDTRVLVFIVGIGILLRFFALPFVQVVDADAVTRIFISKKWLLTPNFITEGVWPPLHYYLNAAVIWITGSHITAPIVLHMLMGAFTAIPIYKFTKREVSDKGAWLAALVYVLSPVIFRNSFHTLSGIPYCFFVAFGLNALSLAIRENNSRQAIYAGLFLTVASGFRYEAWLLIALLTGIAVFFRSWRVMLVFWSFSMIFPLFWMLGNFIANQDFFFGLSGAYKWNVILEGVNASVPSEYRVLRWLYFPMTWFFIFSPILSLWLGVKLFLIWRERKLKLSRFVWAIPFWVMLFTFVFKASEGTLLLQPRFTCSLILLSVPFLGLLVDDVIWTKLRRIMLGVVIASILPFSHFWMTVQYQNWFPKDTLPQKVMLAYRTNMLLSMNALPRLEDQRIAKMSRQINENLTPVDGLILDFWTWQSSYYFALYSNLDPSQIHQVSGATNAVEYVIYVKELLEKCPNGVIVLKCNSKFRSLYDIRGDLLTFKTIDEHTIRLTPITHNGHLYVFRYTLVNTDAIATANDIELCPVPFSREHFRNSLKDNLSSYNACVLKSYDEGTTIDEVIEANVDWIINDREKRGEKVVEN
ncbi:glycosyltransferase family 39 protein [Crocinitomicaceae bacterium]|nr:glycosyltransferase family 39 protein [Crocinitomicaceae bacterium]